MKTNIYIYIYRHTHFCVNFYEYLVSIISLILGLTFYYNATTNNPILFDFGINLKFEE